MVDINGILESILKAYRSGTEESKVLSEIAEKIEKGNATYAEVLDAAIEHGAILSKTFKRHLPLALDGQSNLAEDVAEALIRPPMVAGTKEIAKTAARVQKDLNQDAKIGINFIEPAPNMDQIEGIISGLTGAESYDDGIDNFLNRVENCMEGFVDDCVRDNAAFQYDAGLSPKIQRVPVANCCPWCSRLGGTYEYDKVKNTGNDVFRRHRNCHCQVLFQPAGSKKRQNVHSKRWTEDGKADRISFALGSLKTDLQLFARKTGDYRRMEFGANWEELSLNEILHKYARGAKKELSNDKTKIRYFSKDGRYEIKYDRKGDYFRIIDRNPVSKSRPCLDKFGSPVLNITEDGKMRSATQEEYEQLTHFKNSDKKGKR